MPKELTTVTPVSKFLAMILFVAFPFVGFFLGVRYQERQDLYERQQAENILINRTPTPTPDETKNWKTHTSQELGFSIKYPDGWIVYDNNTPPCKGGINGYVFINKNSLKDCFFADRLPADFYIVVGKVFSPLPELLPKDSNSPSDISGETGILNYSTEKSEGPRRIDTMIFVNHSNRGYTLSYPNIDYKGSHEPIYDQILATFKFADQDDGNQIACTQDVKECPDGSFVPRQPPNCEFAVCP